MRFPLRTPASKTAAIGKGFAIGSAAFATVSLISAYVGSYSENPANPVLNIAQFTVMAGAIVGGALVEFFAALLAENTIRSAHALAVEGNRQLSIPGVIQGTVRPDYQACIALASKNALARMVIPSILALLIPVVAGFIFGVGFVGGILIGATVVAIPRAIFMGNSGGAWDNAKKYVEEGELKLTSDDIEKVSGKAPDPEEFDQVAADLLKEVHKTTVIGDTIGDTNKDVIGVALDIFIKTMSTVANNIAPMIVSFHLL